MTIYQSRVFIEHEDHDDCLVVGHAGNKAEIENILFETRIEKKKIYMAKG